MKFFTVNKAYNMPMQVSALYRLQKHHIRRLLRGDEVMLEAGLRIVLDKRMNGEELREMFYPLLSYQD